MPVTEKAAAMDAGDGTGPIHDMLDRETLYDGNGSGMERSYLNDTWHAMESDDGFRVTGMEIDDWSVNIAIYGIGPVRYWDSLGCGSACRG